MDYVKWVPNSSFKKIRGSMGMKGILDIIGCWEGKYIELEVKTEKGSLTREQQAPYRRDQTCRWGYGRGYEKH
jgi:hypothetical protein